MRATLIIWSSRTPPTRIWFLILTCLYASRINPTIIVYNITKGYPISSKGSKGAAPPFGSSVERVTTPSHKSERLHLVFWKRSPTGAACPKETVAYSVFSELLSWKVLFIQVTNWSWRPHLNFADYMCENINNVIEKGAAALGYQMDYENDILRGCLFRTSY